MKTINSDKLRNALSFTGIYLYKHNGSDPTYNAERNLEGRTHYVDTGTRKYFGSRILSARPMSNDFAFYLVESVSGRPNHGGYNKRFVAFDVFGEVLTQRNEESWFRTSEHAYKAGMKEMDTIDILRHTQEKLIARAKREVENAKQTLAALK